MVIGSSGSGKSTLLNMIGLLDHPTQGKVMIDGFDTSNLTDNEVSEFRNEKLGFVFQFANLLADLTVLENVLLPSQIQFDSSNILDKAKMILEQVAWVINYTREPIKFLVVRPKGLQLHAGL